MKAALVGVSTYLQHTKTDPPLSTAMPVGFDAVTTLHAPGVSS